MPNFVVFVFFQNFNLENYTCLITPELKYKNWNPQTGDWNWNSTPRFPRFSDSYRLRWFCLFQIWTLTCFLPAVKLVGETKTENRNLKTENRNPKFETRKTKLNIEIGTLKPEIRQLETENWNRDPKFETLIFRCLRFILTAISRSLPKFVILIEIFVLFIFSIWKTYFAHHTRFDYFCGAEHHTRRTSHQSRFFVVPNMTPVCF